MDFVTALPVFFVTLREGVEASLVVGIVLACLSKAQAEALHRQVYWGIGAGLGASVLAGVVLSQGLQPIFATGWPYAAALEQGLKGLIAIVAIVLLSWMLLWMTQQAKGLKGEIERSIEVALENQAAWSVFTLVFVAILREGIETVLFIGAQFQEATTPFIGAIGGVLGAVLIGLLIFKGGVKLNLRLFFQVMGVLLLLIVGGLVVTALRKIEAMVELLAVQNLHGFAWCTADRYPCLLGSPVWDLSSILPDQTFPGILLKAFLGYTQNLYLLQAILYVAFLGIMGRYYWKSLN